MAPVEPSFIMFSVKLQGSEAVSVRVVACSVTFFFRNALLWCSWGLSRVVMLIMGHHHQDINNFLAESARHGWTRKQKWSLCQGERGVIKQSFQYNTTSTSRKKHEILPSHWGHIKRKRDTTETDTLRQVFVFAQKRHYWCNRVIFSSQQSGQVILNENKQKTKVAESYRNPVFEEFSSTFLFPVSSQCLQSTDHPDISAEPDGERGVLRGVGQGQALQGRSDGKGGNQDDSPTKATFQASILLNPQLLSVADSGAFLCLPLAKK